MSLSEVGNSYTPITQYTALSVSFEPQTGIATDFPVQIRGTITTVALQGYDDVGAKVS